MRSLHPACCVLLLCLLGLHSPAAAAEPEILLVVGVISDGRLDSRLTERMESYLRSTEQIISSRELRAADRRCREQRCLYELAQRKGATALLFGDVILIGNGEADLSIYKMQTATRLWHRRGDIIPLDRIEARLEQLVREVLTGQSSERPRAAASLSRPVRRLSVPEQLDRLWRIYQEPRPALSPGRKRVGFALLAAGGLTLGAAVLVSLLGSRYNTPGHCFALGRDDCIDRGLNLSTSGYAIGGGLALAGMLTLALPERRKGLR